MSIKDNINAIYDFIKNPRYEITRNGSIKSLGVELGYERQGYLALSYVYNNKKYRLLKHRIIWAKFGKSKLTPELVLNHKDGNKKNNCIDNLEQITQGENTLHRFRVLHHKPVTGHKKISKEQAEEIRILRSSGWKYKDLINKFNIGKSTISYIINNKIWK